MIIQILCFSYQQLELYQQNCRKSQYFDLGKLSKLKNGQKIKKVPSLSWEKFKIRGEGVFGNKKKSPKFQRLPKTDKIMTHFHFMRTHKHNILSIVVLIMAKYTIISLILIDFVPILFNFFRRIFRGSIHFLKFPIYICKASLS